MAIHYVDESATRRAATKFFGHCRVVRHDCTPAESSRCVFPLNYLRCHRAARAVAHRLH